MQSETRRLILLVIGYILIAASSYIKIPQILKIYKASSGSGITKIGTAFELFAYTGILGFNVYLKKEFFEFGEFAFLVVETFIVFILILYFIEHYVEIGFFMLLYAGFCVVLFGNFLPDAAMTSIQIGSSVFVAFGKFAQIKTNHDNGHTGQLSTKMMEMLTALGVARIFTAFLSESPNYPIIASFIAMSFINFIILYQIWKYREATQMFREKDKEVVEIKKSITSKSGPRLQNTNLQKAEPEPEAVNNNPVTDQVDQPLTDVITTPDKTKDDNTPTASTDNAAIAITTDNPPASINPIDNLPNTISEQTQQDLNELRAENLTTSNRNP